MAVTVHHIDSGPSVSNAHVSVSFTPTANAAIMVFASGGYVSGGAGITWSITDSLGSPLTYTDEGNIATTDTYSEAQLWSAKAPASPVAMTITVKLHATNTSEMGFTVWEDTDADADDPIAQAVMAMRDQVSASSVATSGNITSGSLSSPASGSDRLCIFGVQVNEDTGTYTTDTPLPTGWVSVSEELGQWNGQVLISSTDQTSATMAWSDNLVVYQDIGSAIIEMNPATDLPYLVGLSTASESSLTENHAINYPTVAGGIEADDFIILTTGVDQSTNPGNIYPPSGFNVLLGVAHGATGQKLYSWFKRADGTETDSDTETWTTSASDSALSQTHMRIYRGVNNGADADSWKVSANRGGTSTAPDPHQVPNVPWYPSDGTRCVAVGVAYYNGVNVDAGPTGYSHLVGDPASNTVTLFTADSAFVGASPNPGPFTISASDDWRVHSIALAPPSDALSASGVVEINSSASLIDVVTAINYGQPIDSSVSLADVITATGVIEIESSALLAHAGVTSIFNGTANDIVGQDSVNANLDGKVLWSQVKDGIDGTIELFFDARMVEVAAASFTDINSILWTLFGTASIENCVIQSLEVLVPNERRSNVISFDDDGKDQPITGLAMIGEGEGDDGIVIYRSQTIGLVPLWEAKHTVKNTTEVDLIEAQGDLLLGEFSAPPESYKIEIDPELPPFNTDIITGSRVRLIIKDLFSEVDRLFWVGKKEVILSQEQQPRIKLDITE